MPAFESGINPQRPRLSATLSLVPVGTNGNLAENLTLPGTVSAMGASDPLQTLVLRRPGSAVEWAADTRHGHELRILPPGIRPPEFLCLEDMLMADKGSTHAETLPPAPLGERAERPRQNRSP